MGSHADLKIIAQSARNDSSVEALLMLIYLPRLEQTVVYLFREAFPDFSMVYLSLLPTVVTFNFLSNLIKIIEMGGFGNQVPLDAGQNASENGSMVVYPAQVLRGVEARRFATGGLPLYCEYCNLTWMARSSSNETPPGQRAPWDEECPHHDFSGLQSDATQRQLVVFIDDACPGNGSQNATAGVGVYFGRYSTYNISEPVISLNTTPLTNQKAELSAAICALEMIRENIIPHRHQHLKDLDFECKCCGSDRWHQRFPFQVVLVTDSFYLYDCISLYVTLWRWEPETQSYINGKGKPVTNSKYMRRIVDEISKLAESGVQVLWMKVWRDVNKSADRLAKAGAKKMRVSGIGV